MKNIIKKLLIFSFVLIFISACSVELEHPSINATSREVADGFMKAMTSGDAAKAIGYMANSENMESYEIMTKETEISEIYYSVKYGYSNFNYKYAGEAPDSLRGDKGVIYYYNFYDGNIGISQLSVIMFLTAKGWRVVDL